MKLKLKLPTLVDLIMFILAQIGVVALITGAVFFMDTIFMTLC